MTLVEPLPSALDRDRVVYQRTVAVENADDAALRSEFLHETRDRSGRT